MPTHGRYNSETHLPDNSMQPRSKNGLYVWLNEQVQALCGQALLAASQQHGNKRYTWLLAQLAASDDTRAHAVVEEYHRRHKVNEHERRQAHRRQEVIQLEALIATHPVNEDYLARRLKKIRISIEKAEQRYDGSTYNSEWRL